MPERSRKDKPPVKPEAVILQPEVTAAVRVADVKTPEQLEAEVREEVREKIKGQIIEAYIQRGDVRAGELIDQGKITVDERKELVQQSFAEALRRGKIGNARSIASMFQLGELNNLITSPEHRPTLLAGLAAGIRGRFLTDVQTMLDEGRITPEEMQTPEFQELAKEAALVTLGKGNIEGFDSWVKLFKVPVVSINPGEIQDKAYDGYVWNVMAKSPHVAERVAGQFGISKTDLETKPAAVRMTPYYSLDGRTEKYSMLATEFGFPVEELVTPEFQEVAKLSALKLLSEGKVDAFDKLVAFFKLTEDFVNSAEVHAKAIEGIEYAAQKNSRPIADAIMARFDMAVPGSSPETKTEPVVEKEVVHEGFHSRVEVENIFKQLASKEYKPGKLKEDEKGVVAWYVEVSGDKPNEYTEYSYRRGVSTRPDKANASSISATRYEDDVPVDGGTDVAEYLNGAWVIKGKS
ncbi:MAG: hypothetical protein AAB776_02075 [Patescibacteria group bacterium]